MCNWCAVLCCAAAGGLLIYLHIIGDIFTVIGYRWSPETPDSLHPCGALSVRDADLHWGSASFRPWARSQSFRDRYSDYRARILTMQQQAARQSGRRVVFWNEGIGRPRLANIALPSNITYGVELEGFYPSNVDVATLQSALRGAEGWRCDGARTPAPVPLRLCAQVARCAWPGAG